MDVVIEEKTGRKLVSPHEAAKIFSCDASYFRKLYQAGELKRVVESPRRVYYYLEEVQRLSKEKAEARKKRGGRPRKSPAA
jgi:DNA-directed RNA polymerase subunit F